MGKKRPQGNHSQVQADSASSGGETPHQTETERLIREALGIVESRPQASSSVEEVPASPPKVTARSTISSDPLQRMSDPLAYSVQKEEARHERFHDLYVEDHEPDKKKKVSRRTDRRAIRSAIVWKEILGPPKSLE